MCATFRQRPHPPSPSPHAFAQALSSPIASWSKHSKQTQKQKHDSGSFKTFVKWRCVTFLKKHNNDCFRYEFVPSTYRLFLDLVQILQNKTLPRFVSKITNITRFVVTKYRKISTICIRHKTFVATSLFV